MTVGGVDATGVTVTGPTTLTATFPVFTTAGPQTVRVITAGGTSQDDVVFRYKRLTELATISSTQVPPDAPQMVGGRVTFTTTLTSGELPFFVVTKGEGTVCTVTDRLVINFVGPGDCRADMRAPGNDLYLPFPTGFSAFTTYGVIAPLVPEVQTVSPASGPLAGGTGVTIQGLNLFSGATVTVGGVPATNVVYQSNSRLSFTVPPGVAAGAADIVVTSLGVSSSTAGTANDFTYLPPAPTITSVSPAFDNVAGGKVITITGTDLATVTGVSFGGTAAGGFSVNSDGTQITVTAPARATGTVNVAVTTLGGTSADNGTADDFEYGTPPLAISGAYFFSQSDTFVNPATFNVALGFTGAIDGFHIGAGLSNSATISGVTVTVANDGAVTLVRPAGFRGEVAFPVRAYNRFGLSVPASSFAAPDGTRLARVTFGNPTLAASLSGTGAQQGTALSGYAVQTTGGLSPYTCALATGNLPSGVTLNSDCTFSGTPGQSGTFDFAVDVTDSSVGPGVGAASVPNPFTQRSGTLSLAVAAVPAPVVTAVSPAFDNVAGGKTITITGTNLSGATGVSFGGTAASGFTVSPDGTQITVNAPARAAGTVNVAVTTPGGTSADAGTADDFEYGEVPQIDPSVGPLVSISYNAADPVSAPSSFTDRFFTGTVDGFYIGAGTDSVATVSGITLSVDAGRNFLIQRPAGFRGGPVEFPLRAYNKFGVSEARTFRFAVANPFLASSLSGSGAQRGVALSGYSIVTTGGLAPYSCATTPATGSLPAGVSINPDCTITGTPAQSGTFTFTVDVSDSSVGPGGPDPFTVRSGTLSLAVAEPPLPTVATVSPSGGVTAGGTAVTITGTNLKGATGVSFGSTVVPAASFISASETQIVVLSPAGTAGTVNVSVTTPLGTSADAGGADDFLYGDPDIQMTSVFLGAEIPDEGVENHGPQPFAPSFFYDVKNLGTTPLVLQMDVVLSGDLSGRGFGPDNLVTILPGATQRFSLQYFQGPGNYSIEVIWTSNDPDEGRYNFTINGGSGPVVTAVSPALGPLAGGTAVTITGTNFGGATRVNFGATEVPAAAFTSVTATQIVVNAPAAAARGTVDVSVTTPVGTSADSGTANDFAYLAAPVITSVSPAFDNVAGGKVITITGTDLAGATGVSFGGTVVSGVAVNPDGTRITVNAPAGTAGTVNITVTTPGGTSADAGTADDFEYGTAPTILAGVPSSFLLPYAGGNPAVLARGQAFGAFGGTVDGLYLGSGTDTSLTV